MSFNNSMRFLALDRSPIDDTLAGWQRDQPRMGVVALLPEAEKDNLPVLQAACRARGVPLVGGIFPALIEAARFRTDGVWLLRSDTMVPAFLIPDLDPVAAGAAAALAAATDLALSSLSTPDTRPTLFLVFDGLGPHISSTLDGLYLTLADRVTYAGVNAGSETFQPMPCLFDQDRVVGNGVLGLLLPGRAGTVLAHGYPVSAHAMTATSTAGNQVITIDWRPAFDAYQEIIRAEYGIALTRDNFYQYAVHFPFGIVRANEEVVVRIPVAMTDDGSLYCVGEVPENAMLVLLRAPEAQDGRCIDHLVQALAGVQGGGQAADLLTFYCAGRRMHLGDAAAGELAQLARASGAAQMAGALSLGEIGSTHDWGYPMFHNAALVCTPWHRA
jgi:hypothetical protein